MWSSHCVRRIFFYLISMCDSCISGHLGGPREAGYKGQLDCRFYDQSQNVRISVRLQIYSFQATFKADNDNRKGREVLQVLFGLTEQCLFGAWKCLTDVAFIAHICMMWYLASCVLEEMFQSAASKATCSPSLAWDQIPAVWFQVSLLLFKDGNR